MRFSERLVTPGRLLSLTPFGAPAGREALVLRAGVDRAAGLVRLRYVLGGPVAEVRIPARAADPLRSDRLWECTCFEAFLGLAGGDAYWEVNLSPSGHWNVYRFDRHREGMRPETRLRAPLVGLEHASCGTLTIHAELDLAPLTEVRSAPLEVGLAAVLEAKDGTHSYWALEHGAATHPDFHRREGFVLRLDGDDPQNSLT
jgi:hypothetical protein